MSGNRESDEKYFNKRLEDDSVDSIMYKQSMTTDRLCKRL